MITITYSDSDDNEVSVQLPSKKEVCRECDGESFVLCSGMRGHAYTASEFAESFDEEEAAEYFRAGGRYDVKCPTCKGQNVEDVIDVENLTAEQRAHFEAYCEHQAIEADYERTARAERAAERAAGA